MATDTRAVSVGTTATRLDTAESANPARPGASIAIYNNGSATVYIGDADVTTANGYPLAAGQHYSEDQDPDDAVYGIVASGTVQVRVREVGI